VIVYSALFGGYDTTPAAPFATSCRHVLFTDAPVNAPGWEVVTVEPDGPPRLQSRSFKLRPHVFFPGQDVLYHDANMTLARDPQAVHAALLADAPLGIPLHRKRHTLSDEFAAVRKHHLADPRALRAQEERYQSLMGAPIGEAGLLASTPEAEAFMTAWWDEVSTFTHRDQLALPWATHETGITPHLRQAGREGLVTMTEHLKSRRHS